MEEGELVLCKVEKVTNTVTFVSLPSGQEGTIVSSEIAAGRIKFMRDYVVPNKQIVCKVLKIEGDHVHLSLRRVSSKEKKEVMSAFKQSQTLNVAFKQILGEDEEKIKEKILQDFKDLSEFTSVARNDESLLKKYIPKEKIESIKKIINKRKKDHELKLNIKMKCLEDDGVKRIKQIFNFENKNVSVQYISAEKYRLKLIVQDFKEGKKELHEIIENLEKKAKENNCEIFITEEK